MPDTSYMPYGMLGTSLGGLMQAIAAEQSRQAMYNEYLAELRRQGVYQDQATAAFTPNIQASGAQAAGQQLAQAAGARKEGYNQIYQVPLSQAPNPLTPQNQALAQANAGQLAGQRAKLGAYGDWQHNVGIGNQAVQRQLDQITNFAGGQARVFPIEMYQAQHAGDPLSAIGSLIGSAGRSADALMFLRSLQPPKPAANYNLGGQGIVPYQSPDSPYGGGYTPG